MRNLLLNKLYNFRLLFGSLHIFLIGINLLFIKHLYFYIEYLGLFITNHKWLFQGFFFYQEFFLFYQDFCSLSRIYVGFVNPQVYELLQTVHWLSTISHQEPLTHETDVQRNERNKEKSYHFIDKFHFV